MSSEVLNDTSPDFHNHIITSYTSDGFHKSRMRAKCGLEFETDNCNDYIGLMFTRCAEQIPVARCLKCREGWSEVLCGKDYDDTMRVRSEFVNDEYPFAMK